jgi:putative ABC transport system permease protein
MIARFFRRARWDEERRRELEAYLQIEADENIARGMPPDEARAAARRKLGNVTLIREEIYHMNTIALLDAAWRDLRYGFRLLRLNPGFAVVAMLSLALGVGANTAIFQLLDAVRLRTLPVERPEQLVEVRIANAAHGRTGNFMGRRPMMTNPLYEEVRDTQQVFSGLAAWGTTSLNMARSGEARYASGLWVNGDFFATLGVRPLLGRLLTSADDRRGCTAPAAVVSYGFWQRELGGEAAALGRPLWLEGHDYEIVGVTPPRFFGLEVGRTFDVALPLCSEPLSREPSGLDKPDVWFLGVFGRLKPSVTQAQADAQLAAVSPGIFRRTLPPRYRPEDTKDYVTFKLGTFAAGTGVSGLRRDYEAPLWLLLATTGLILVIACANLANLMLARATAREREIAVRLAIGASRGRVVRQLLAESLVLAVAGAAGGFLLAQWLSRFLVGFLTTDANRLYVDLASDWRVFAFTGLLAVATCLVFGLAPAIRATAGEPGSAMKAGSRGSTDGRERFGLRRGLVVVQVALSLVLVVGALLFVRSLRNLVTLDAGFRQDGIVVANVDLRGERIPEGARRAALDGLTDRLRRLPGVDAGAAAFIVPVSGAGWNDRIVLDGRVRKENVNFNSVTSGYFRTMATPLLTGRDFDARDTPASRKVAIVTEEFARQFFGGASPVGRTFQVEAGAGQPQPVVEIVGLVKDAKYGDLKEAFTPIVFFAATQDDKPDPGISMVLRSAAPLATITREVVSAVTADYPTGIVQFQTLNALLKDSLARERLMATLSGCFGLLAGVLATIGLYGVMAYMVERRRNEIGIRLALGAERRDVVRMIMREAGRLLVAGLVIGSVAAIGAAQWARAMLFGLTPRDPATFVTAVAVLSAVAVLASYVPAWRASRLEPTAALREE